MDSWPILGLRSGNFSEITAVLCRLTCEQTVDYLGDAGEKTNLGRRIARRAVPIQPKLPGSTRCKSICDEQHGDLFGHANIPPRHRLAFQRSLLRCIQDRDGANVALFPDTLAKSPVRGRVSLPVLPRTDSSKRRSSTHPIRPKPRCSSHARNQRFPRYLTVPSIRRAMKVRVNPLFC